MKSQPNPYPIHSKIPNPYLINIANSHMILQPYQLAACSLHASMRHASRTKSVFTNVPFSTKTSVNIHILPK